MHCAFIYKLIMIGNIIGTAIVHITPVMKATIVVSESVEEDITGRQVSIAVAAAGAIASKNPMYFAINGIVIRANISLITFDKNASADSSVE